MFSCALHPFLAMSSVPPCRTHITHTHTRAHARTHAHTYTHTHTTQQLPPQEPEGGSGPEMWHMVLQELGGDYKELSMNVRAHEERKRARDSSSGDLQDGWSKEA